MNTELNLSVPNEQSMCLKTRNEVLDVLERLIYNDSEAFFSLLGSCTVISPMKIEERPKNNLIRMGLLDIQGLPPLVVRNTVKLLVG